MLMRDLSLEAVPASPHRARVWAAAFLRMASQALDSLAERVAWPPVAAVGEGVVEFHAEAGALEGALYVDGRLVGHVLGVTRL